MAKRSLKPCNFPNCSNLTDRSYCKQHSGYEHSKRSKLYKTARWIRERQLFLMLHPFCYKCGKLANTVDHDVDHKGNMELFWDQSKWRSMCSSCHSKKTAKSDRSPYSV